MNTLLFRSLLFSLATVAFSVTNTFAQEVPIINYGTNSSGQVLLEVNSTSDKYYILEVRHHPDSSFTIQSSMTLGTAGTTIITEPLRSYPQTHYRVIQHDIASPSDTDGDGFDDIMEFNDMPNRSPLNFSTPVTIENGQVAVEATTTFNTLSVQNNNNTWSPYLNGKEFLKFIIFEFDTDNPRIYFINTNTHELHQDFGVHIGTSHIDPGVQKGHIIFHPTILSSNGTLGTYAFNYTNNESRNFEIVQRTQELLAANMPYLSNNLSYYVNQGNEPAYNSEIALYQDSRVPAVFESDVYAGIDYWGLNQTEGYGFFRQVSLNEVPGPKDIVLYSAIPNTLPRVGGIMTSAIQTPLSHVNLRAIHDNIPNAFIRDPLANDTILNLLNHYVYYKVEQSNYEIREATLEEVNAWYEKNRPKESQEPPLNLDYTEIKPLDHITFDMFDGFGAKVANVATMRTFGFPDQTIPDGFGIPFYFYQEFMKHNGFFDEVQQIMNDPGFISDRNIRDSMLTVFRTKITEGELPDWMYDKLTAMQFEFPLHTPIRCRSSTNNEDLPGFSGAGLYESKTQNPNEGHIEKSIKEVYSSLWNLRAFEERDFSRINHFTASMGILAHLSYSDEKVNGVGVSADPVYNTDDTYYLNSQLESELITNPGGSVPEELIMEKYINGENGYSVIQYSGLVGGDTLLMTDLQLDQLRNHLTVIHDEFAKLYNATSNATFAMDIEYKITSDDRLIIKQARPWVSYKFQPSPAHKLENCELFLFPNPARDFLNVKCEDCQLISLRITDMTGKTVVDKTIKQTGSRSAPVSVKHLEPGIYLVSGFIDGKICDSQRLLIR